MTVATPTVYAAFTGLSPEFKLVPESDPYFQIALGLAEKFVGSDQWGDSANYAKALLIAHFRLTIGAQNNSGRGPVTSESVGGLSRSYAQVKNTDDQWDSTSWGRSYRQLRDAMIFHPMVI